MFSCWAPTTVCFGSSLHYVNNDLIIITYITHDYNCYIFVLWLHALKYIDNKKINSNSQILRFLVTRCVSIIAYLSMNPSHISAKTKSLLKQQHNKLEVDTLRK